MFQRVVKLNDGRLYIYDRKEKMWYFVQEDQAFPVVKIIKED